MYHAAAQISPALYYFKIGGAILLENTRGPHFSRT